MIELSRLNETNDYCELMLINRSKSLSKNQVNELSKNNFEFSICLFNFLLTIS